MNRRYPDLADGGTNEQADKKEEEHKSHVIVASEPTTYKDEQWALIEKNTVLCVEANTKVHFKPCPYQDGWDAEDSEVLK